MSTEPTIAVKEGAAAKAAGQPMDVNPYRAGSQESADWLEGFTADEEPDREEAAGDDGPVT